MLLALLALWNALLALSQGARILPLGEREAELTSFLHSSF